MKMSLLLMLFISLSVNAGVEDIQSMFNLDGIFRVNCMDGFSEEVSASQINANQVCDTGFSTEESFNKCRSVFGTTSARAKCAKLARKFKLSVEKIEACRTGLSGDASELECVMNLKYLSLDAIKLCTTRIDSGSNRPVSYTHLTLPTILLV